MELTIKAFVLTLVLAGMPGSIFAADAGTSGPNPGTLLNAGQDDANWILPAKTYSGNRFTGLVQIDKSNVATLSQSSLKPEEYASLTAFLPDYDCVKPAGNGQQPFSTADLPALQQVELGGATCTPR